MAAIKHSKSLIGSLATGVLVIGYIAWLEARDAIRRATRRIKQELQP